HGYASLMEGGGPPVLGRSPPPLQMKCSACFRLRAIRHVVRVSEPIRAELRARIRNMRIHVHLRPTVKQTSRNLTAPLRVHAASVVGREDGNAGSTVVVPHLDVLV